MLKKQLPTKILYPKEFFPVRDPSQQRRTEEYVAILEKYLGTRRTEFSLEDRWLENPPDAAKNKSLKEYLGTVSNLPQISAVVAELSTEHF